MTSRRALGRSATALTVLRLGLAVPVAVAMATPGPAAATVAGCLLAVAVLTDVLDGRAARAAGTAGPRGQFLDHGTDCVFSASALAGAAARDAVPWVLPVLVVTAFAQYVVDSRWLAPGGPLRGSRLGRWNGMAYFGLPAVDVATRIGLTPAALTGALALALTVTTVVSMGLRARWTLSHRTAVRRAGRPDRSGR